MSIEAMKLAFEKMTGVSDAWTNPAFMQARNGFVQGWEAAIEQAQKPEGYQEPVAVVAEVHMSRYTIEWTNGPFPEGTQLYTSPPQRQPLKLNLKPIQQFWRNNSNIDWDELEFAVEQAARGIKE